MAHVLGTPNYRQQYEAVCFGDIDSIEVAVLDHDVNNGWINGNQVGFITRKPKFNSNDQMVVSYKGKSYPVVKRSSAIGCLGWACIILH